MKRQKSKPQKAKNANASVPATDAAMPGRRPSRRAFLESVGIYGAIGAAVIGGGWYMIDDVMAKSAEMDLSKIGNGVPTVVQIHDPDCPRCRALQREARDAMAAFDETDLQYVVANIRGVEGRRLANEHGVGHVTLLLLDGDGERRGVLVGENQSTNLEMAFRRHLDQYGAATQ